MKSQLAHHAEQTLIAAARRLTPEQRLAAFVTHCQLVRTLQLAGAQARRPAAARASA